MSGKIYSRVKERQADARYRRMLARARAELFPAETSGDGYIHVIKQVIQTRFPFLKGRT
jgi:hypothetical protein